MKKSSILLSASLLLSTIPSFASSFSSPEHIRGSEVFKHLEELEKIAKQNNGNRSAGTRGHELSGEYVANKLAAAGYKVTFQPFDIKIYEQLKAGLALTAPEPRTFEEEKEFALLSYSPSATVKGAIIPVDISLGRDNTSTSGCEASDYANFPKGNIALVQRGTCTFQQKTELAQAAGASGVVVFNQGNTEQREGVFHSSLGADSGITIPAFAISYPLGVSLLGLEKPELQLISETKIETRKTFNVLAESAEGNAENVVMVGSHLDSVSEGPGMNDNASGSAGILEIALRMAKVKTVNKLRFGFWGAEEMGLIGSEKYVASLSAEEKSKISLYLNVDMIGSPNYMISVFDGDGSKFGLKGPEGSASIERLFHMYFRLNGIRSIETQIDGRSDYAAFAEAGIPIGGVFTGAEGIKTQEEAEAFGGEAGVAYDKCYHSACDDLTNISVEALEINTNAMAFMTLGYSHSTASLKAPGMSRKLKRNSVSFRDAPKLIDGVKVYLR